MQDIQDIVNNKVASLISEGTIQKVIEDGVQAAIEKAIKSQFESWGNITKQLEEAMKAGLQINTRDLPFEVYNTQMLVAVKARMGAMFQGAAAEHFLSEIDKVLAPVPKEITIVELVNTVAKSWKTDEPWDADDLDHEATVELQHTDHSGWSLKMGKKESSLGARYSQPDLQLYISEDGRIRINHKQKYNPTCFSEHEAFIFKLYAAGTHITGLDNFDPYACDLVIKAEEY